MNNIVFRCDMIINVGEQQFPCVLYPYYLYYGVKCVGTFFLVASFDTPLFRFFFFNVEELVKTVHVMRRHNHTAWTIQFFNDFVSRINIFVLWVSAYL